MPDGYIFYILIAGVYLLNCFFWGFVTNAIVENKGRPGKAWFWWGFLFGIYAMALALTEPDMRAIQEKDKSDSAVIKSGGWICGFCGYANSKDAETCRCGKEKAETLEILSDLQVKEMMK